MTELSINGLLLGGSSTIQLKFWSVQGGLLHSYKKKARKLLGSNQVFDKSKRRIKWRGSYFFGQVWWFKQGIDKTLIDKTCSLSDSICISVLSAWTQVGYNVISAFTLDSGERVLVNRWDRQALSNKCWYISTGDGCLRAWAMPAPGRRVRWDRTDPLLLFIQTLQVIGEREISGVLRITEQTSSLTPKNRWDFGLFRFSYCESAFREDNLIWFSRDVPALAKKLRTLPILFDLDLASSQEAAQMGNPILNILTL